MMSLPKPLRRRAGGFPATGAAGLVGGQDAEGGEDVEDFLDVGLLGALEGGSTCGRLARALESLEVDAHGDQMKPKVHVETTILSYLTALPSRDLVIAAHQQLTSEWWQRRQRFSLFVSEVVLAEAARATRPRIEAVCEKQGFRPPVICTPEELVEQEQP
jgi:hypothetical protein